jgi:transposase
MSVAVYPRLSELLRAKNLSVAELERQIEQRFGLSVDPKTLYRLTYAEPVQRADLQIAGAAAAVLGVELGDLFQIEAVPVELSDEAQIRDLGPEESQRLADLFAQQARGTLPDAEQAELEALVAEYGQRLHERRLREIARRRGISVDQARREVATQLDEAMAWWRGFEADPERRRAVVRLAKRRRAKVAE